MARNVVNTCLDHQTLIKDQNNEHWQWRIQDFPRGCRPRRGVPVSDAVI